VKQSFRPILQSLLTDAENLFAEIESKIKNASDLTAMEISVLEQRAYAALGKRDGIRACIAAWDAFLDAIKQ